MTLGPVGTSGSSSSSDKCYEPPQGGPRMSSAPVRVGGGAYDVSSEPPEGPGGDDCFIVWLLELGGLWGDDGEEGGGSKSQEKGGPPWSPGCFELQQGVMMRWPQPMLSKPPGGRNPPDDGSGDNVAPPDDGAGGKADDSPQPPDDEQGCNDKVKNWLAGCSGGASS